MNGPDLSEWDNGRHPGALTADWMAGWDFIIVRAANENGVADRFVNPNVDAARASGRPWGLYAWPVAGWGREGNARHAASLVASYPGAPLGYWADYERSPRGLPSVAELEGFCAGVAEAGGLAGFYSNIPECPSTPALDALPWWMADYGPNDGRYHDPDEQAPRPWRPWVLHQFTSRGWPGGGALDVNYAPNLDFAGSGGEDDDMPKGFFVHAPGSYFVWYIAPGGYKLATTNTTHIDVMAYVGFASNGRDSLHEWSQEMIDSFPTWDPTKAPAAPPSGGIDYAALAQAVNDDHARRMQG